MAETPQQDQIPVYDISGKEPVKGTIAPDDVHEAISSGQYSFPKGMTVPVISPDGTRGTIDAHEAPDAFKQGYQYVSPHSEKLESVSGVGQQIAAGLEGFGEGVAGPVIPALEVASGITTPENMRLREEAHPWTHGLSEAGGFIGGALTGTGEAALASKIGEGAVGLAGLGEASSITGRLAASATKMSAEMALIGAANEGTKAITQDPNQSIGSAVTNIGLNALLGAAGGGALTGLGMAGRSSLEKLGINSENLAAFKDRLLYRGANLNPNEAMQSELKGVMDYFDEQGSEIGGANGLKSQALGKLMPPEITPEISQSVQDIVGKSNEAFAKMAKEGVPDRLMQKFQGKLQDLMEVVTNSEASVAEHFDALNEYKKELALFSKGNFGAFAVPAHSEAYDFLKITKELGHGIKESLEDPEVWGKDVSGLQKDINSAWQKTLGSVKQVKSKFMSPVGDEFVVDPAKFNTFVNQAGKATSETVRQKILGSFLDGMEDFHKAVSNIYEKAGMVAPESPGMGALKEALDRQSLGSKLADVWYDKLASKTLGTAVGSGVGGALGHALPIPGAGYAGVMLGGKLGESVLPSFIQPLLEKAANSAAFNHATAFGENVLRGDSILQKASNAIFSGGKVLPAHLYADNDKIEKLDKSLAKIQTDPMRLANSTGDLGHYMPDHAQALSQTAMNAANYLNAQRPQNVPKQSPLDSEIKPTKAQENAFKRTLSIAQQPLTVLEHIQKGTLMPQDVTTLRTLYPSYYNKISQEIHNAMTDHLSNDGKIPYKLKQSMSLFLGQPLESSMLPGNIQAAQLVFAEQSRQKMQAGVSQKKGSALNKMADRFQTTSQASEARQRNS